MSGIQLGDRQRAFIRPLLPPPARTGRPRADDRRTIEGALYVLITGCRWQDLPREYGAPTIVWRRLSRWGEAGLWERIWRTALAALEQQGKLDWSMAFLDGSFVPAKRGGEKVGLTEKGKGTRWMLVVDGNGLPLGFHLDSASRAEVRLAQQTLDTIKVAHPHAGPRRWSRTADMIVARFAVYCEVVVSACVFHPSGVPRTGRPSGAARWSHAKTIIGRGSQWSAASPGWAPSCGC